MFAHIAPDERDFFTASVFE